jgi:hypothetical protein
MNYISIRKQTTLIVSLLLLLAIPCDAEKGGKGGGKDNGGKEPGSECGGGVHVCDLAGAFQKCGVSKKRGRQSFDPSNPARNVMCCCHSDVCPQACFEEELTYTGQLDELARRIVDGNGEVQIVPNTSEENSWDENEAIIADFEALDESIRSCNARGELGGVDMVPKCARVDTEGILTCPTGGATDVPSGYSEEIIGSGQEFCVDCDETGTYCYNEWCDVTNNPSCPDGTCICKEDSQLFE